MFTEKEILAALVSLKKPVPLYTLKQRLCPHIKSTEGLHDLLIKLRADGKVTFDINTGFFAKVKTA